MRFFRSEAVVAVVAVWMPFVVTLVGAAGCESAGGGGDTAGGERQQHTYRGTVVLMPEEGLVLANGRKLGYGKAQTRNADLMVFAHSGSVKVEAGTPDGTMARQKTAGGRTVTVATLEEVPNEAPAAGSHDYLPDPETGEAFVVGGNVTDGFARCRVLSGPGDGSGSLAVEIEFEATWWD